MRFWKIALRDWNFQASLKISSEPSTKPLFSVGNSEGQHWTFQAGLKFSSEIEFFKREWFFSRFGPLGNGALLCFFLGVLALFCALLRVFFLSKWAAKKRKFAQNSAKMRKKRFYAIPLLVIPPFACHRLTHFPLFRSTTSRHPPPPISRWGKTVDSYRRFCGNNMTSQRKRVFSGTGKRQIPLREKGGGAKATQNGDHN